MHYEVRFTGTETERTDQAWQEILAYVGDMKSKLVNVRKENKTEGNEQQAKFVADTVGMFWGISGYHPNKALQEFFMGTRNI